MSKMGIEDIMQSFDGDIGYYIVLMGILAILRFYMGTLEIFPIYFYHTYLKFFEIFV